MLPQKVRDAFINGNATMLAVIYDSSTSSDETMDAVTEIRKVLDSGCYLQGMSAVITDTKDLAEAEEPIYVALAVLLASIVLALSMDTFLAPVFYCITGFSSQYSYFGPNGEGDRRTGEARQAKTVDFDVVKHESQKPAAEKAKPVSAKEESEVEFDFNQNIPE
jgi:hypothetical protein